MRSAERASTPRPRHSNSSRNASTSDTIACAFGLPSRTTARVNSFSTSARPVSTWRTSMRIACITSSGSKPAMTTGLR